MRLKLGSFRKISRPLYSAVGRTSKDTQRTSPRLRAAYWVATLLVPVRRQEMKTSASPAYCCVTACSSPARCRFSGQTQTASVTHDGQHRPSQQRENVTPRRPPQRPGAKQEQSGVTCLGRRSRRRRRELGFSRLSSHLHLAVLPLLRLLRSARRCLQGSPTQSDGRRI